MKINVSQLRKEMGMTENFSFQEKLASDFLPDDCQLTGAVSVTGTVTNSGDSILLKGKVEAPVRLQCIRCLTEFDADLKCKLDEEYVDPADAGESDEDSAAVNQEYYTNSLIELDDLVREMILLAIPMQPLCQANCKGLCVQCGQNLNEGDCDCETDQIDIRLEALRSLLEKQD